MIHRHELFFFTILSQYHLYMEQLVIKKQS